MPPIFDEVIHKAFSNNIRKEILIALSKKEKYLSEIASEINKKPQTVDFHLNVLVEIGLVSSEWRSGKKYYILKNKKIVDFLEHGKHLPHASRPKPPHEIVLDMWEDMKKRMDKLEKKIDELSQK